MVVNSPLLLREVPKQARTDFHAGDETPAAPPVREVLERWTRSRHLGASPDGPEPEEHLRRGVELRAREEQGEVVRRVGGEILEQTTSLLAPRNYVLLVSDPRGTVLRVSGGGEFAPVAQRVRLIEGADWSEEARGTNAIGTAIAERRPVFVRGSAHYARRFQDLVCYAAPIHDAEGNVVAVLDATSRFAMADESVGYAIVEAARALERALRSQAYAAAGHAVARTLGRALDRMGSAALLVEPPGRVARMNEGARVAVRAPAGAPVSSALRVPFEALCGEAFSPSAQGLAVVTAGGPMLARVEPIESSDGHLLTLLVFLEPPRRAAAPALAPRRSAALPAVDPFAPVFTEDAAVERAIAWARRLAPSAIPIMILAETGGGKELFARAIHAASPRADAPFRAINCGSLAPSLLENELFGHGPSAFTGAERRGREGLLAVASGGTLFLDEVAEMPAAMQAALLRVLEDGTYQRVGETSVSRCDVRVVCATCRDLDAMVASGAFRKDLYYRLHGARVALPPLRQRTDIVPLARHVLRQLAAARGAVAPALTAEVEALFREHPWPGNVRELRSTLEVALVLAGDGPRIGVEHLPPDWHAPPPGESATPELAVAEGSAVRRVLAEVAGNVSLAAQRLGVARSTLYRMMRRHGLREGG